MLEHVLAQQRIGPPLPEPGFPGSAVEQIELFAMSGNPPLPGLLAGADDHPQRVGQGFGVSDKIGGHRAPIRHER